MNILKVLHREEKKLSVVFGNVETKLSQVRAAITALNGKPGRRNTALAHSTHDGIQIERKPRDPRRGRKLSAAHRKAIKDGIAKAKRAKA